MNGIRKMADVRSNEPSEANHSKKMKVDDKKEEPSPKQDNSTTQVEDFKICSPSNPFKSTNSNPFTSSHNNFAKSILKPSLLSVNSSSSSSSSFILRQSGFNPFNETSINDNNKSDINSDKKQINGEVQFVPLVKNVSAKKSVEVTKTNNTTACTSTSTFVFGQNLEEKVTSLGKSFKPLPSASKDTNGISVFGQNLQDKITTDGNSESLPSTSKDNTNGLTSDTTSNISTFVFGENLHEKVKSDDSASTSNGDTSSTFVFGQNLQEKVISDGKSLEALPSTSKGETLFSYIINSQAKSDTSKEKETKSLTESAREYEESRANKRKYDEVQVKTGEEEETNIISISCKLFAFDKASSNWQERGRGTLRLNDYESEENHIASRLVFRAAGSLRVILNTKIWAEMTIDKANEKSIRLTAIDSNGEIKVFLIMSTNIDDSRQLFMHLQSRLQKEIALQKRKKAFN